MGSHGLVAPTAHGGGAPEPRGWTQGPHPPLPVQLLGSWYVLAVASSEKGFVAEKATKSIEGVVVSLTPEDKLRVLSSRHR